MSVANLEDYNRLGYKLREGSREHYTYQLPHKRKYHVNMSTRIVEELGKLNIAAEVYPMTSKRTNSPLPLYVVKTENPRKLGQCFCCHSQRTSVDRATP